MKKVLPLLLILLFPLSSNAQNISTTTCPGAGCIDIPVGNQASVGIQISGTWVGTITFQSSVDGTNFTSMLVSPVGSSTAVSTTTANGQWLASVSGLTFVRAVFTAYTSGTATVNRRVSILAHRSGGTTSGGGGGAPGGSDTQIQFNNAGAFGGTASLTWDGTVFGLGANQVITKADPSIIFTPATATDTRYWISDIEDAGVDDDDLLQVGNGATPGTTPIISIGRSVFGGDSSNSLLAYSSFTNATNWRGVRLGFDGTTPQLWFVGIGTGANANGSIRCDNATADSSCLSFDVAGNSQWAIDGSGDFVPNTDNTDSIGRAANRVASVFAGTSVNVAASGNATLRNGVTSVGNVGANSCGTTAATIAGNNTAGKVTVGATAGTQCRITFSSAWANAPACVVTNETTANLSRATSTTTTVDLAGTFNGGDVLSYICVGY